MSKEYLDELRLTTQVRRAYRRAQHFQGWAERRELYYHYGPGYGDLLGYWRGEALTRVIDDKIRLANGAPITVVDVGSGPSANFLRSLSSQRKKGIQGVAVNSHFTNVEWERERLAKDHVRLVYGDVHYLTDKLPSKSADIVVSCVVFPYLVDPWGVVNDIHKILKPGGVAFINEVPLSPVVPEFQADRALEDLFVEHLRKKLNMDVAVRRVKNRYEPHDVCALSWSSLGNEIDIPLRFVGDFIEQRINIDKDTGLDYQFASVAYNLDRQVVDSQAL